MNLGQQRILITGGTRGIGFELAKILITRRAHVAVCGKSAERIRAVSQELPGVESVQCDLSDIDALPEFVDRLHSSFGPITVLVNNAGIQFDHSWLETDPTEVCARLRQEIEVNLTAPLTLTALLLDDLLQSESAAVVNVSSTLALKPKRSAPVYCATKAAIRSFSQALRYQLAAYPEVRVVEVIPPLVDTAMTRGRGRGKISAARAAHEIVHGLEQSVPEIYIGKAKLLRVLHRISPALVARLMREG